jgi:hypothetical protein
MKSRIFTARDTYYNTLPVPCNNVRSDNPVGLASILTEGVSMVSQPPYRAFLFSPSQRLRDHAHHPFPPPGTPNRSRAIAPPAPYAQPVPAQNPVLAGDDQGALGVALCAVQARFSHHFTNN